MNKSHEASVLQQFGPRASAYVESNVHAQGEDLSEAMVEAVLTTATANGITNIAGEVAGAEALPFDDGAFDYIACRFSAHHWRDFPAGLREARRVLAPGGAAMFVDVVSHANPAMDMHLQAIELLRDPSHVRNYRPDEWAAALGGAGFALVTMRARRLRMDFAAWIARMRTSPTHVAAIRSLQKLASANIADHFQIEPDGSFTLDTMVIEAR